MKKIIETLTRKYEVPVISVDIVSSEQILCTSGSSSLDDVDVVDYGEI